MNATAIMIAKLAAAGIVCTGSGYVARPVVEKTIARIAAPSKRHAPPTHKRAAPKRDHISTTTVAPCAVAILPMAGVQSLYGGEAAMMDDDVEDATQQNWTANELSRSRGRFDSGRSSPGGFGIISTGGGGGATVSPSPTPEPTAPPDETPVSAIPEPATWAMIIVGFAATGWAMRAAKRAVRRGKVA